jgi:outer membrane protein OmpA-like peptidoglycan-associated protein
MDCMSVSKKFVIPTVLVVLGAAAFAIYYWIEETKSQRRQMTDLGDQFERMNSRIDLLTEVIELASARAARAEESARVAADARREAEAARAVAQDEVRISKEEAAAARMEADKAREERQQELDRLQEALSQLVETRRTALGLVMNLDNDAIQFDFDRAELLPENRELLSRIAGILLTARGYSIYVYGHTDDVGAETYNFSLSERRARVVRDYLVDAGVDPELITTRGYGKSSPRNFGTTAEARAMNRRVEIGIVDVSFDIRGEVRD